MRLLAICLVSVWAAQAQPNLATVEGQILDQVTSVPLRKPLVTLSPRGDNGADVVLLSDSTDYRVAQADASGRFVIENVVPGEYKAFAWEELVWSEYLDPDYMRPLAASGMRVSVEESGRPSVNLIAIPADVGK